MPKYLIKASYSESGMKGVMKEGGTAREEAVSKMIAGVGGRLESFYFSFGETDAFIIVELPDNVTAAALAATVGSAGVVSRYETVTLLTPAEIDAAGQIGIDYRPPGG